MVEPTKLVVGVLAVELGSGDIELEAFNNGLVVYRSSVNETESDGLECKITRRGECCCWGGEHCSKKLTDLLGRPPRV